MSDLPEFECSLCGRDLPDGIVPSGCDICRGGAQVQSRAHTLSDSRSGRAPKVDRYTDLAPKESPLVVGGAVNPLPRPQN